VPLRTLICCQRWGAEETFIKKTFSRDLCFASGEGVSGPVVLPTVETHERFITNGYLRMKHGRGQCNGIEVISRGSLNKSSLFCFSYHM